MTPIRVEAQLAPDELLRAVEQLNDSQLDQFVAQVIALRAQRRAPPLPKTEGELLKLINEAVPTDVQRRYAELIARRDAARLTPDEHAELLRLTNQVEQLDAQRVEHLAQLAQFRGTSLRQVMADLGIRAGGRGSASGN